MPCARETDGVYGWRCAEPCKMKWSAKEGEDYRPPLCLDRRPEPRAEAALYGARSPLMNVSD